MASGDRKPRVLVAAEWFTPAFRAGGPIRSVANLVEVLGETHDVWVVAGAYDLAQTQPLPDLPLNEWIERPWGHVMYLTHDRWKKSLWQQLINEELLPDYIYLNSLFARFFALIPLRIARLNSATQIVLAPRGMLGPGALAIKSMKKRLFLFLAKKLGWFKGVRWHASSVVEASDIARQIPNASIQIASNVPSSIPTEEKKVPDDRKVLVVLGRIHAIKNIEFGMQAVEKAVGGMVNPSVVEIQLIGPAEDAVYLERLLSRRNRIRSVVVEHLGALNPADVSKALLGAHYLLMPSLHENYGHAIVEAWAHGCPVFLSDRTPWTGLAVQGVGWDWPLELDTWAEGLRGAFLSEDSVWKKQSQAAQHHFNTVVRSPEILDANRRIFSA